MAKVLMVDDEADMEFLVRQKFKTQVNAGEFELLFAKNGIEALDVIENNSIDVLISDVNMPGMDGLTLLEKIKKQSPETRSIIVSAYGDMETLRKAMNRGAFDFVIKPVDYSDLYDAISKSISNGSTTRNILNSYKNHLKDKAQKAGFPWANINDAKILFDVWEIDPDHTGIVCIKAKSKTMESPLPTILVHNKLLCVADNSPESTLKHLKGAVDMDIELDVVYLVLFKEDGSISKSNIGDIDVVISEDRIDFVNLYLSSYSSDGCSILGSFLFSSKLVK